jgi:hypothetical protein
MDRYFFDYFDGAKDQVDIRGVDHDDDEAALAAARAMLAQRAPAEITRGGDLVVAVRVRRGGHAIFIVSLAVTEEFRP